MKEIEIRGGALLDCIKVNSNCSVKDAIVASEIFSSHDLDEMVVTSDGKIIDLFESIGDIKNLEVFINHGVTG